jgi:hypothetical protein
MDLVRTRLAVQTQGHYYHGILPTLQRIVADEGAVGLYRGLGATLLQVGMWIGYSCAYLRLVQVTGQLSQSLSGRYSTHACARGMSWTFHRHLHVYMTCIVMFIVTDFAALLLTCCRSCRR